jgi:hypothetical protein
MRYRTDAAQPCKTYCKSRRIPHRTFAICIPLKRHRSNSSESGVRMSQVPHGCLCQYTVPLRRTGRLLRAIHRSKWRHCVQCILHAITARSKQPIQTEVGTESATLAPNRWNPTRAPGSYRTFPFGWAFRPELVPDEAAGTRADGSGQELPPAERCRRVARVAGTRRQCQRGGECDCGAGHADTAA